MEILTDSHVLKLLVDWIGVGVQGIVLGREGMEWWLILDISSGLTVAQDGWHTTLGA